MITESVETRKTVTKTTVSSSKSGGSETFLTNKTKVTGVQDVINRMSAEGWLCCKMIVEVLKYCLIVAEVYDGETAEDAEARALLNKFLGSQVLLSGMESRESHATSGTLIKKRITKVTTTTTVSCF